MRIKLLLITDETNTHTEAITQQLSSLDIDVIHTHEKRHFSNYEHLSQFSAIVYGKSFSSLT